MAPRNAKTTATESAQDAAASSDIVQSSAFSDADLRKAEDFAQLAELAAKAHGSVVDASKEMGDGFSLLDSLVSIAGFPTLLMEWTFRDGDYGTYVSIRGVSRDPKTGALVRYIYNDGSSGICKQLQEYTKDTNRFGALMVQNGFRVSEYEYEDPNTGQKRPAETWYLNV